MENVYLTHHGTKGMRWGIRRYQNKDGSLTAAGKKRYNKEKERLENELKTVKRQGRTNAKIDKLKQLENEIEVQKKKNASADAETKTQTKPKSVKDMTDDEIRSAIARKQLENQYKQYYPEQVSKGEAFMKSVVDDMVVPALKNSGRKAVENMIDNAVKKYTKETIDPKSIEGMRKEVEKLKLTKELKDLKEGKESLSDATKKLKEEADYEFQKWRKQDFTNKQYEADKKAAENAAEKNAKAAEEAKKSEPVKPEFVKAERVKTDSRTTNEGKKWADDVIIDAEWKDVTDSDTSVGQSYVNALIVRDDRFKHSDEDEDELYHHGVKGMKWGVRRYQNKDGSLTPAGKKRLAKNIRRDFNRNYRNSPKNITIRDSKTGIRRKYRSTFDALRTTAEKSPEIKALYNSEDLKKARDKYVKAYELSEKFYGNQKLVKEYQIKASRLAEDAYGFKRGYLKDSYLHEDGDQGEFSSFKVWLKDQGVQPDLYSTKCNEAKYEYREECKKAANNMLSVYGNIPINSKAFAYGEKKRI